MNTVAFRADGGSSVGMGHAMRCISLAKEFKKSGYRVYFLSKMQDGIDRIKEEGYDVIGLSYHGQREIETAGFFYGSESQLGNEAKEIIQAIKEYDIDILFIDSYNVTKQYFLQIKPHVKKLAYIDDINKFVYPIDILINGNITGEYMTYKKYSEDEILLLGPKYNLIRDGFRNLPDRFINKDVKEIMIATGGADPYNMITKIVNMILFDNELSNLKMNVIIGSGFRNREELRRITQENSNVILYENVKQISKIMLQSDIAISAGGSTLYELCACGTPTLTFIMADNQELLVEKMQEKGYVNSLGWYDRIESNTLLNQLIELMNDYELRKDMSKHAKHLVDARGVERIVKLLSQESDIS